MENDNKMIFVEGMNFKPRPENAPETFRGGIYFKYPEFARFMEAHKNEKGWVNIKMMKSKEKGTIYFILDTWKPTSTPEQTQAAKDYNDTKYTDKDRQNVKEAVQVGTTLSDEDLAAMDSMPF